MGVVKGVGHTFPTTQPPCYSFRTTPLHRYITIEQILVKYSGGMGIYKLLSKQESDSCSCKQKYASRKWKIEEELELGKGIGSTTNFCNFFPMIYLMMFITSFEREGVHTPYPQYAYS